MDFGRRRGERIVESCLIVARTRSKGVIGYCREILKMRDFREVKRFLARLNFRLECVFDIYIYTLTNDRMVRRRINILVCPGKLANNFFGGLSGLDIEWNDR